MRASKRTSVLSVIGGLQFGGDENRLLTLSKFIDRGRFDHKILVIKRETPELAERFGTLRPRFIEAGAEIIDLNVDPDPNAYRNRGRWVMHGCGVLAIAVRRIQKLVREFDADIIDAHVGTGNIVGVAAGLLTHTPTIVTTYNAERFRPAAVWYVAQQTMLSSASAIITDAARTRKDIARWMLRRPSRSYVIPNGTEPPEPTRSADEMRALCDIPPGAAVVGTFARLVRTKGQRQLLEAARSILSSHPEAIFLLVGYSREASSNAYRDELVAHAKSLGIDKRVRFLSYPGPIGDVWQIVDIHVHPSLVDSLPNAILEGMSLGKPQVVTALGDVPRTVIDGETGFVVPPGDVDALSTAILKLLDSPSLMQRFGDGAHARYLRGYRPEQMARSIERVFLEIAS
jgi:glycosyltransferase involved in cell wall biosynthesis